MSTGSIIIATSIPPNLSRRNAGRAMDADYQKLCLRSWLECGFRVLSVNHPDEIPALARSYPEVSFVAIDRDARAVSGRPTPYIADLLRALLEAPEPIAGIINSDIVFEPTPAWRSHLPRALDSAVIAGQRYDATSLLDGTFRQYYWGFDYFFFQRNAARDLVETAMPFAMGLPWWDYWLPAALSLRGREVVTLERPAVAHLIHKEPQLDDGWRQLAMSFAHFIVREAAIRRGPLPPCIRSALPVCHELVQMPDLLWRNRGADAQISQIAVQFVPAITSHPVCMPAEEHHSAAASDDFAPMRVFEGFAERLSAGKALEQAKRYAQEGRIAEAGHDFQHALERTPNDFDLLCAFGDFVLRNGEVSRAAEVFRSAIEKEPESSAAPLRLAIALHQGGAHAEASRVLKEALVRWPDLTAARDLLARVSY